MKDYSEISLAKNVGNQTFIELSNRIELEFEGKVVNDLYDLESKYRDFVIHDKRITLHENSFDGILIFPTKLGDSKRGDNLLVERIGFKLKYRAANTTTWAKFRIGSEYEINYLLEEIHYCRAEKGNYEYVSYEEYSGSCEDHDHCQICSAMISCKDSNNELYSSAKSIVCVECYKDFINENNYIDKIISYEKFRKSIIDKSEPSSWLKKIFTDYRKKYR